VSHPTHRAGRPSSGTPGLPTPQPAHLHHAPHAALLIDFDNVTLGIRSDLTKELRTLLNSDIIKGKVAVQRAYADWRRYPQYIVPLSESSIDLIFAPAFGTNKKNATDIRLAVDAIELVFTRPEIGTFILLSGDSDFSSLVLKLKEYGKYVIGVGIRESASDLLIQNCDEYHSYSDLTGLTRESDRPSVQRDPWELVGEAVLQMSRSGDVMRSDRLKQVMQQLDPNFDEKNAGFSRFSKFVTEAGNRGLLRVTKLDNGQYEVAPSLEPAPRKAEPAAGRRGGGRKGRGAEPAPVAAPAPREEGSGGRRGRGGRGRGGRGRGAGGGGNGGPVQEARVTPGHLALASAFQLLERALAELPAPVGGDTLRARMAALHGREDPLLEPGRFARLLRQANDAEIADVRKIGEDSYEVTPHRALLPGLTGVHPVVPAVTAENGAGPAAAEPAGGAGAMSRTAALRFRRGSRALTRPSELSLVGVVQVDEPAAAAAARAGRPARGGRRKAVEETAAPEALAGTGEEATEAPAAPAAARRPRGRRGGAGRKKEA
jgi:uncharacterized protein (TIGR00288 family)